MLACSTWKVVSFGVPGREQCVVCVDVGKGEEERERDARREAWLNVNMWGFTDVEVVESREEGREPCIVLVVRRSREDREIKKVGRVNWTIISTAVGNECREREKVAHVGGWDEKV